MPLPERLIEPVSVSRGTLSYSVPDELEGVTNGTLANIIRQLSSLSRHAEEMFGNLLCEAEGLAHRSSNMQARIDRLAVRVTQLDSNVEESKA
jgi:WAS family protein